MTTTILISVVVSFICFSWVIVRVVNKIKADSKSHKINLKKGDKIITISDKPSDVDRRKLAHF